MTLLDLLKSPHKDNHLLALTMMESQFDPIELRDELKKVYQAMEKELHKNNDPTAKTDTLQKIGPWYSTPPHTDQIFYKPSSIFVMLEFNVGRILLLRKDVIRDDYDVVIEAQDGFYWWEMYWHEGTVNDVINAFDDVINFER